jgi:hypothetical protein
MKIDARSMRELSGKQVRTRTSFHRQVALPFSCEKGALRVRAAWMGRLSATFWRAWKKEGKNWMRENGHLLSRLSRTPGARLDVACSRLEARVIYQAATANMAMMVQELTRGDLQCVCVAW